MLVPSLTGQPGPASREPPQRPARCLRCLRPGLRMASGRPIRPSRLRPREGAGLPKVTQPRAARLPPPVPPARARRAGVAAFPAHLAHPAASGRIAAAGPEPGRATAERRRPSPDRSVPPPPPPRSPLAPPPWNSDPAGGGGRGRLLKGPRSSRPGGRGGRRSWSLLTRGRAALHPEGRSSARPVPQPRPPAGSPGERFGTPL